MALIQYETVMYVYIHNIEDPTNPATWENVRMEHINKADKIVIQYQDEHGLERQAVVKDRFGYGS